MREEETIEIKEFELRYDGIFKLKINIDDITYEDYIYLSPSMLFKIIESEGLQYTSEELDLYNYVQFTKTTLILEVFEKENERYSFLTSEEAGLYQDIDLYLINVEIKD
jgi:hypothetical protein